MKQLILDGATDVLEFAGQGRHQEGPGRAPGAGCLTAKELLAIFPPIS